MSRYPRWLIDLYRAEQAIRHREWWEAEKIRRQAERAVGER